MKDFICSKQQAEAPFNENKKTVEKIRRLRRAGERDTCRSLQFNGHPYARERHLHRLSSIMPTFDSDTCAALSSSTSSLFKM
jgi:hypothetical protein